MKLILTHSIKKAEFETVEELFNLEVIKIAAKKSLKGLGKSIKSASKISGTQLKKIYITSSRGAGRVIFLLKIKAKKSVLVMVKPKSDKRIGMNMSIQNPKFEKALKKNLDLILKDLESGKFEEFEL